MKGVDIDRVHGRSKLVDMVRRAPAFEHEHQEQRALITWCRLNEAREPRLKLLYAISNGRKRSKAEAGKLKAEGVRAGVPDLCLPVKGSWNEIGLYIEMKSEDGRESASQKEFRAMLENEGHRVCVARSWMVAADTICDYLNRKDLARGL